MIDPELAKTIRLGRSWTQAQMARSCNVHLRTYSSFEAGKNVSHETRVRIANAITRSPEPFTQVAPDVIEKEWFFNTNCEGRGVTELPMYAIGPHNLEPIAEYLQRSRISLAYEISTGIYWPNEPAETKKDLETLEQLLGKLVAKPDYEEAGTTRSNGFLKIVSEIENRQMRAKKFKASFPEGLLNRIFAAFVTARSVQQTDGDTSERDLSWFAMILAESSDPGWKISFAMPEETDSGVIADFNEKVLGQRPGGHNETS